MIHAYFRFYEELNDFLPLEKRKIEFEHIIKARSSVKDVIESIGVPHSEIDLILVNYNSVDFNYIVQDDDRISVYPVFESFDISEVTHLRPKPLRDPKYVLDVHLGKLARYLRMLGIDSVYENSFSKDEIINISLRQKRTILTRDRNLLKKNEITHGYWIRSEDPIEQTKEVIFRFHLESEIKEFSLCLECNYPLQPISKAEIINSLPPKVFNYHNEYYVCKSCGRNYWRGTHYEKMKKLLSRILPDKQYPRVS